MRRLLLLLILGVAACSTRSLDYLSSGYAPDPPLPPEAPVNLPSPDAGPRPDAGLRPDAASFSPSVADASPAADTGGQRPQDMGGGRSEAGPAASPEVFFIVGA